MLGVESLPLKSIVMDINRYDWLKSIVDLALSRFSSIRDMLFHFINEVLELRIESRKLNIQNLKKVLNETHPEIIKKLKLINEAGPSLREDRNQRMPEGFSNLFTEDDDLFKNMSWTEGHRPFFSPNYNLENVYESPRDKIYDLFIKKVENILEISIEVIDALCTDYSDTFGRLSKQLK